MLGVGQTHRSVLLMFRGRDTGLSSRVSAFLPSSDSTKAHGTVPMAGHMTSRPYIACVILCEKMWAQSQANTTTGCKSSTVKHDWLQSQYSKDGL